MIDIARHALAFVLTVGLIAGGIPAVHAVAVQVQASVTSNDTMHPHHMMHDHMQHDVMAQTGMSQMVGDPPAADKSSNGSCKTTGLKCCSMCMTAYVAPALPQLSMSRVGFAVMYRREARDLRDALPFIDPGIPIA